MSSTFHYYPLNAAQHVDGRHIDATCPNDSCGTWLGKGDAANLSPALLGA